jgi:hypothetical protein
MWVIGLALFSTPIVTKWQASPQEIVYVTTTISAVPSRVVEHVVEPERFGFSTSPIDPKLSSGLRIESDVRYSVGGVQKDVPFDETLQPGPAILLTRLKGIPDQVDEMQITGTLYDAVGTGNSKLAIIDRTTGQELTLVQVNRPGEVATFSFTFPTTTIIFTTTVFTFVTTTTTTTESPITISVVGQKWPTNWVFVGDQIPVQIGFNEHVVMQKGKYVANLTYLRPSGRSFTIRNQTTELPLPRGRREIQFPTSTTIVANETGRWDIFVESELYFGENTQKFQTDLTFMAKLPSDIAYYQWILELFGVPTAIVTISVSIITLLRRKTGQDRVA